MDVVHGLDGLRPSHGRLFIVVGVFDGLHRGHAYLLRRLVVEARARSARPAVITFDSHPDEILMGAAPPLLVDPAERVERLRAAGVEVTVVQHFDRALRETTYRAFVAGIVERTGLAGFLMTPDAAFGYRREGTPDALASLGAACRPGFDVAVVPPYVLDGHAVRSTEIRAAIASGDLVSARRLLGRAHAVVGTPTAPDDPLAFPMPVALPPAGTYAVQAGSAWRPGWRGRSGVATVGEGIVRLDGAGRRGSVRVAFASRPGAGLAGPGGGM
jgi:riboflavin kinase / FMN adenylyltransferase